MNLPMKNRIDELIDAHGSIALALASRRQCIARRASEGKTSPCAEAEVAAMESLPPDYTTPNQRKRDFNMSRSCGE